MGNAEFCKGKWDHKLTIVAVIVAMLAMLGAAGLVVSRVFTWSRLWDMVSIVGGMFAVIGVSIVAAELVSATEEEPPKQRGVMSVEAVTFIVVGILVLVVGLVMGTLPAPKYIRPYDAGYTYRPLAQPTAYLTRAIQSQTRWQALQAVRTFSFWMQLGPNGTYMVGGRVRPRHGSTVTFGTRHTQAQVARAISWMHAFPHIRQELRREAFARKGWGAFLSFYVQRVDGRYNFYLNRHWNERAMFTCNRVFLHGVLTSMMRALAIAQRNHRSDIIYRQIIRRNRNSWG